MAEQLQTDIREDRGTKNARRLRQAGRTPAIVYGQGKENVAISIDTTSIQGIILRGQRLVELTGAVKDNCARTGRALVECENVFHVQSALYASAPRTPPMHGPTTGIHA